MKNINLIPAPRRAAKRRRVHLRRCVVGCTAWAVVSVAMAGMSRAVWHGEDPQAAERLARVNDEINRTDRAIADLRAQLAKTQSTLRANEAIAAQPDWSVLLALLGKQVENDVVLKSAHVRPANTVRGGTNSAPRVDPRRTVARPGDAQGGAAGATPAVESIPYIMEASGLAEDYPAANRFVLRLERTGLFSKVTLLDTARESFLDKNKVAFRLECTLDQSPVREEPTAKATANVAAKTPPKSPALRRPVAPAGRAAASGRD
jgi:hypothetical protein